MRPRIMSTITLSGRGGGLPCTGPPNPAARPEPKPRATGGSGMPAEKPRTRVTAKANGEPNWAKTRDSSVPRPRSPPPPCSPGPPHPRPPFSLPSVGRPSPQAPGRSCSTASPAPLPFLPAPDAPPRLLPYCPTCSFALPPAALRPRRVGPPQGCTFEDRWKGGGRGGAPNNLTISSIDTRAPDTHRPRSSPPPSRQTPPPPLLTPPEQTAFSPFSWLANTFTSKQDH